MYSMGSVQVKWTSVYPGEPDTGALGCRTSSEISRAGDLTPNSVSTYLGNVKQYFKIL